jgi:hypothetical protein
LSRLAKLQETPSPPDKSFAIRFFDDAVRVFETALEGSENVGILTVGRAAA